MILRRYLIFETFKSQLGILFVLTLIFLSQQFVVILEKAVTGVISPNIVSILLFLSLPKMGILLLPISFYLAILFAHGRLHGESEMVAMMSCGYSPAKILNATLFLSFFTFAFAAFNSLYLAPAAENKIVSVIEASQADAGIGTLIEGRFHNVAQRGSVIYVEKYENGKQLKKIFVAYWPTVKGKAPFVLTALSGKAENRKDGTWVMLEHGQRYAGIIGEHEFDSSKFERFGVHMANSPVKNKKRDVDALSTLALLGVNNPKYKTELQWRIAIPLSILFLTFVAVPMAIVNPREGRYSKLFSAIALYLVFFLLLSTSKSFMDDGSLPIFSIWGVQIIFLVFGCFLQMRSSGKFNRRRTFNVKEAK